MCSSECDRVSNLLVDQGESDFECPSINKSSTMFHHSRSSNSTRRTAHPHTLLFSLYMSLLCVVLFLTCTVQSATIVKRRAISAENTSQQTDTKYCHSITPCGWAVYTPVSRRVTYYMKNVCECPTGKECLKSDDDLSVSAYVYRCKDIPSNRNPSNSNYDNDSSTKD
ncbi:uncharacterized protein LOC103516794 isoform X2 [Diaphorina citri]|uniref:Uncharacterized protein LOC103516794 isoform X1 n=1 Tax=Diaphorina citri TaxID=121845 RepID=A0A1S3DFK4_DIACI|nr:uncharacterized protein LOC103516794 isoform X1 [Diaphorina citri]XP_026684894.1 uncharacterized protein LOC103516794 isoform X2 [Diaphorina citri]KAI5711161.1 hypothetical protein M8J75_014684 [Diaphorina citri]KAI5744913.1 hypothetical protein M8J76_006524 [Diaphorina citri]KAI5753135.1 hypothetical protein M8J77_023849 [Diaphorina citri]